MGNVVKLESGSRKRAAGTGTGRSPRARPARSKTALVLGGGGFTGAVYEIGALRALDLLSVNRTVNDFDVYVGTSAGALVAALTANGVTPEQMMRVVNEETPTPFRDINLDMLLRPNYREFLATGAKLPLHVLGLLRGLGRSIGSFSTVDLAIALADILPSGLYSGSGLEEYVRTVLNACREEVITVLPSTILTSGSRASANLTSSTLAPGESCNRKADTRSSARSGEQTSPAWLMPGTGGSSCGLSCGLAVGLGAPRASAVRQNETMSASAPKLRK